MDCLLVLLVLLVKVALQLASEVTRVPGRTGINMITRVFGINLAALAVQLVADGLLALWRAWVAVLRSISDCCRDPIGGRCPDGFVRM
ncbi:MAG: hypothetical protein GY926_03815 [bacterium]|nr:hypothetical protein [bacterium]